MKTKRIIERNSAIDILKFACAIGVIFLHTLNNAGLTVSDGTQYYLCKIFYYSMGWLPTVEIFFITSAYLLFAKMYSLDENKIILNHSIIHSYIKRLIIVYLSWSVPYIPMIVRNWPGRSLTHNILSLFRNYLQGYSMQMWYIPSTVIGTIIVYCSLKVAKEKLAWCISWILYVFALVSSTYYYVFENPISEQWIRIFGSVALVRAPIYIMLGYQLATVEKNRLGIMCSIKKDFIVWVITGAFRAVEMVLTRYHLLGLNQDVTLIKQISAYYAVRLVISLGIYFNKELKNNSEKWECLGTMSTVMYFCHVLFVELCLVVFPNMQPIVLFLTVTVTSVIVAYTIYEFREKRPFKLLT